MQILRVAMEHFTPLLGEGEQAISSDWFTKLLENIISSIEKTVSMFSSMILRASLRILSMIYAPMAVVGVILYVTRINKYLGRDLIYGALVIAFFAEFILPTLL
ncbi:MAG: hypothetical protein FGF52_01315 [Candidatus Brockarchaeota archaeon]|nr:hypothetical protein [Candidatus Brockarchaeota archaeon]